ncbi:hypothetical protein [Polyangium sp. 6x1]|uniref:hypothetical protein n=1 Tax=Polyangium sp. 6x1 TaxID=3042689 RepID=UPI0024829E17|nr:hypothetical protein [Polyangium sp. 6x1]MDI1444206.1 hypothetical protein [Polyangium sp. 6x1]
MSETNVDVTDLYRVAWELLAVIMRQRPRDLAELAVFACPSAPPKAPTALAAADVHGWWVGVFEADFLVGVIRDGQEAIPGFVATVGDLVATLNDMAAPGRARIVVLGGNVCETRSVSVDELRAVVA